MYEMKPDRHRRSSTRLIANLVSYYIGYMGFKESYQYIINFSLEKKLSGFFSFSFLNAILKNLNPSSFFEPFLNVKLIFCSFKIVQLKNYR
jgi:hypothetical protein